MPAADPFVAFEQLSREFREKAQHGRFLLVDLASSTAYKTQNPEINWVTRLKKFYDTVTKAATGSDSCKLLGDGALISSFDTKRSARDLLQVAEKILADLEGVNKELPGIHAITVRIVLSCGTIYPFEGQDPQGSAVDKLFRMEKFVPNSCIGMTEEFARDAQIDERPIASFRLKGLPNPNNHGLILIGRAATADVRKDMIDESRAAGLWMQPGFEEAAPIFLVGGYIPNGMINTVQMGDVNAKLQALHMLASLEYAKHIALCDSSTFPQPSYTENVVTIGGPCFNSISNHFLADLPVGFEIDEDGENDETPLVIRVGPKEQRFESESDQGRLVKDWGLFVRMRNPSNRARRVIIASGIESPAVEGIVSAFTPSGNPHFSHLMEKIVELGPAADGDPIPDFFCVMPFRVEVNHHPTVPPARTQVEHLYRL